MSKRYLLIKVDAKKKTCGKCEYRERLSEPERLIYSSRADREFELETANRLCDGCSAFHFEECNIMLMRESVKDDFERCEQCIAAEKAATIFINDAQLEDEDPQVVLYRLVDKLFDLKKFPGYDPKHPNYIDNSKNPGGLEAAKHAMEEVSRYYDKSKRKKHK